MLYDDVTGNMCAAFIVFTSFPYRCVDVINFNEGAFDRNKGTIKSKRINQNSKNNRESERVRYKQEHIELKNFI